jgi:rhomboid protease GluP
MTDDPAGASGDAPPPWQPPTGEQLFHVWFGGRGIAGVRYRTGALPMLGKGELRIGPDGLAFRGRNQQLVGKRDSVRRFSFDEIKDVYVDGLVVDFTIPPRTGEAHRVRFEAATEERAEAIAALLPQDISPETDAVIEELVEFHERLDTVSPHGYVVPVLLALNVLVFVAMAFGGAGVFEANGEVAVRWGSNFGPLTTGGEWWRLLSSTFIHFGIMHLALNMFALWQTGETVERLYGLARFLALYVCAGLAGSLASLLWHPVINSAGASGAIFGVFGGLLAFVVTPGSRVPRMVMLEHRNSTLLFAGYSLFYGAVHPGIDNAAHIGGLVSGFLVGLLLARPVDPAARARPAGARLALTAVGAVLVLLAMAWGSLHLPGTRVSN